MKKSRRVSRKIDIHSPDMVKTIFILGSMAILAFLVMVVKYTSFTSEPKAAKPTLTKAGYNKLLSATKGDCSIKSGFDVDAISLVGEEYKCASHMFDAGKVWNKLSEWSYYGDWKNLNMVTNKYVRCCVDMAGFVSKSDKFCSSIQIYDQNRNPLGTKDMKCKPTCQGSSITDKSNEYRNNSYYFIPTGQNSLKNIGSSICVSAKMKYGKYEKVLNGTCCSKN
jgi:hypothetical protein